VRDTRERIALVEQAQADLRSAANIVELAFEPADTFGLELQFQELEPPVPEAGAR
jgi:hypothetical protein